MSTTQGDRLRYAHCCVDLSWEVPGQVEALQSFIDSSRDITRSTFCRRVSVEDRRDIERKLGYAIGPQKDLHCADDWHVSYLSGQYYGQPAVAMVHSRIEYMFVTNRAS